MKTTAGLTSLLHRVARHTETYPYKTWGFGEAIAMMGLLATARVTGEPRYRAFVTEQFTRWRWGRSDRMDFADHVTPGVPLLLLAREKTSWMPAAVALGGLFASFPRRAGVPVHRPDLEAWSSHVWVDCLYTDGAFLALLARMSGDHAWENLACYQALSYTRALWDEPARLFAHGYDTTMQWTNAVHWGRGNGWALLGLLDLLRVLRSDHPAWEYLSAIVKRQIAEMLSLQDVSGHWYTVLDHPETYLETSIAAMMAYALRVALRLRLAGPEAAAAADRAFHAAVGAVDTAGALTGVSEATPAGNLATYATRQTGVYPWGQGPLLLAITDRLAPDCLWEDLL